LLVLAIPEVSVITRLHPEDIRAIAAAVAAELRSGGDSAMGVAASGERFHGATERTEDLWTL
jgi:hypothetical protein